MYEIRLDNSRVLWTPRTSDKRLLNPILNLEINKVGSLSFTVLPGHKYYDSFIRRQSIIEVKKENRIVFRGRVYGDRVTFNNHKKVEVEGLLGYFNDSIVRPYSYTGGVSEYLNYLINQHNNQVEPAQRFIKGTVTVQDPNDYIVRESSNNPTTWKEINDKLIDRLGGYIRIRYETDGNYIDYLADFEDHATQDIAFSVNLLDLNQDTTSENLATCIIPLGATDPTTHETVTIKSVNDGLDYVSDANAVALYGKIYEVVTWSDVTRPENLLTKARAYLADKVHIKTQITISAVDLNLSDESIESFKLGDYVRVYSKPHNFEDRVLLKAYNVDLSNPIDCKITLGVERSSYLSDKRRDEVERVNQVVKITGDMVSQSNKDIKDQVGGQLSEFGDQLSDMSDQISQVGDQITQATNDVLSETLKYTNESIENSEETTRTMFSEYVTIRELDTLKDSISTSFSQTAEGFAMQFNQVNERITTENGEVINKVNDIAKYIRYIDGKIILGEVGADLTTQIANGRISFLYNDSVEVAYISDNKLYITEAEILERIVIGNFAFIPRSNGNLSFKYIRRS